MTPLDKPLKRSLSIEGRDYTLTLTPDALRLTEKGRRAGIELEWPALVSGDAALAAALQASLRATGRRRGGAGKNSTQAENLAAPTAAPRRRASPAPRRRRGRSTPR